MVAFSRPKLVSLPIDLDWKNHQFINWVKLCDDATSIRFEIPDTVSQQHSDLILLSLKYLLPKITPELKEEYPDMTSVVLLMIAFDLAIKMVKDVEPTFQPIA
jgi:hypothetical protein